ncbi:MAG: hypothetical protein OEL89_01720 [Candidatus Peregrinibacteria bacterium]|nr:hypothetical protein [Candidatus Peregrinibacteria bacterium]
MAKLKLGILGINQDSAKKLNREELSQLVKKTLEIYPLGEILKLSAIAIGETYATSQYLRGIREASLLQKRYNSDIIAIVEDGAHPYYDKKTGLIYSNINPLNLSHQLGHKLGLSHPKHHCEEPCSKHYAKRCKFSKEIMGCAGTIEETIGFSKSDITTLKKVYKI